MLLESPHTLWGVSDGAGSRTQTLEWEHNKDRFWFALKLNFNQLSIDTVTCLGQVLRFI